MLALAEIYDGGSRSDAALITGVTLLDFRSKCEILGFIGV
jgi:hypothetical protein